MGFPFKRNGQIHTHRFTPVFQFSIFSSQFSTSAVFPNRGHNGRKNRHPYSGSCGSRGRRRN